MVVKDFVLPVNLTVCSTLRSDHFPVTLDLRGRSSFKGPSRPAKLETSRLDSLPGPLVSQIERKSPSGSVEDIDARLDELTNAIHEAMSASGAKSQPAKQPLLCIPPMINAKRRIGLGDSGRINGDPATKNRVNRLQRWIGIELNKWWKTQWADTIESLNREDQSLWKMTKRVMRIPDPNSPLQVPGCLAYSNSEKAEALADNLESQFRACSWLD